MQKKPFQLLFVALFAVGFVGMSGCKKTEDVQIACTLSSLGADVAVINSTLNPAKTGVGIQLVVYRNDSLVDKINRTHNGNTNFNLSGLKPNTDYKVTISVINNPEIVSEPCTTTFKTLLSNSPIVITSAVANKTPNGADVGGEVTFEGLLPVTESGVCWSTNANPSINNSHSALSSGVGAFTFTISTLNPTTLYHVRAYAKTTAGTVYGADLSFTTLAVVPAAPTVTTTAPSGVTQTTLSTGGNVTNAGTATVTARGVCWGTTANPDINGTKTTNGTGVGTFTSAIASLLPSTTYHVRAYATNSVGTSYGADEVVTTLAVVTATVTTTTPSGVTQTTATAGGNVTSNGGAVVTALGVCYSTSANPTLADGVTNNGSGTGGYTSPLTGLTPNTTYHVRAYATNSAGTAYGTDLTFTTLP